MGWAERHRHAWGPLASRARPPRRATARGLPRSPAGTPSWTDYDLPAKSHTRDHVSPLDATGAKSDAPIASPGYLWAQ